MGSTYRRPLGTEKACLDSWKAPEHYKGTSDMRRDTRKFVGEYPDIRVANPKRFELVLDKRPTVMKPERKTYTDLQS